MIDPDLNGRVVLVTGTNNPYGIGAAVARAFATQGAALFLTYLRASNYPAGNSDGSAGPGRDFYSRQQSVPIEPVLDSIRDCGGRAEALEVDLADPAVIPTLFDRAEATLGPIDILVNNAAYCVADSFLPSSLLPLEVQSPADTPVLPLDVTNLDRHFAINTRAVALMMAEYGRRFSGRSAAHGAIINISTDGAAGFPGETSYGASKYAMESFSRAAAVELGPHGITVNVVSLAMVQTGWVTETVERETAARFPLRRIGQPEDVAGVVVFLASQQARWLTGQVLYVGGGHEMSR